MAVDSPPRRLRSSWLAALNGRYHKAAVTVFMVIVIAHWGEHLAQALQIWVLGWPPPKSNGLLGIPFPWLIKSEWLHYGYALVMVVALWVLRHGFTGRSRRLWNIALGIQLWHHVEHLLLLLQAIVGINLFGAQVPTSLLQFFLPRVELHLFYNAIVTIPMVLAAVRHRWANEAERTQARCTCARSPVTA
jgi:hypothetical protein